MSKKSSYVKTYLILFAAIALLTGCGGGGGGTTTPSYTVSATASTGGSISPASVTVNDGTTTSFTLTPNTGYNIASVTGCGGILSGSTYTTGTISGACTVIAAFVPVATVAVSWDTNRESGVNSTGGGYRVYHSTTAGFGIGSADVVDVPHASGTTPTSTTLTLSSGTHYIKVVAYSALNPTGSTLSSQIAVTAP